MLSPNEVSGVNTAELKAKSVHLTAKAVVEEE